MKCYVSAVCVLSALAAVCLAAPASLENSELSDILPISDQERSLLEANPTNDPKVRNRRDLEVLRIVWPELAQVIDNVIQNVTGQVIRVVGGAILRSGFGGGGGGGGGGGSSGGAGGQKVNVVLPTFPPDEDDYEEEEEDEDVDIRNRLGGDSSNTTTSSALNEVTKRQIRTARAAEDQDVAASGGNAPDPAEDLSNVDTDSDADRNKRFLPFGGSLGGGGSGGGAGSGNFLFDIIRNTADRAARTVGTVYRMVAGTENLGFGLTATSTATKTLASGGALKLVAGSGATEESDEKAHSAGGLVELDLAKGGDGYTETIPGPITRLFVIANRGIANLVQDLILRLAQTSERIVNFKARLVTALI